MFPPPSGGQRHCGEGAGAGAGGRGSIEQARFTLAPKIICTDKFADFAHSTPLIE